MKRLMCFALMFGLCISNFASGASVRRIDPKAGEFGSLTDCVNGYTGCQTTPDASGFIGGIGDFYNGFSYDLGVYKFQFPSEVRTDFVINSAKLKGYAYCVGTVYLKIQRYANDNTTVLGANDHPNNATLIDVNVVAITGGVDNFSFFSFDVSSGVAADLAAGKTYSSFLITAVKDASGTPLNGTPELYYIAIKAGTDDLSRPRLEIDYTPQTILPINQVRVDPNAGKFGTLVDARWGYNGCSIVPVNGYYSIGDIYNGFSYDLGVFKFKLPSEMIASDIVTESHINGYYIYARSGGGSAFFKIQRYVNDNTTVLGPNDHPFNASLTDVGIVEINHNNDYFSFDVTSGVAADLAAGKAYSSYLITPVQDAQGTPLTYNWGPDIYYMAMEGYGTPDKTPHLDVNYAAVPGNCSEVTASGFELTGDMSHDCVVDMKDMKIIADGWLECTTPGGAGCVNGDQIEPTGTIARGTAVVNGDLSEWSLAEWVPIDVNIYGNTSDVINARMAMRWSSTTNKIYAAVVVPDTTHWFEDEYVGWDASDCVEVFSQGDNAGGPYDTVEKSDIAQQYFFGSNIAENGFWSSWADGSPLIATNFEGAVVVNGANIIYEFGIQMYDNFAGRTGVGETVVTQLSVGKHVRFDIVVDTRSGSNTAQFGVLASSSAENRSGNADNMAEYELVESLPCGALGYLTGDISRDCVINLEDFSIFADEWLTCNDPTGVNCIENW